MKRIYRYIPFLIIFINIGFRIWFIFYGYIASEEGFLINEQKLAFRGMLPFVHYNGWDSLTNNYIVGFYSLFIKQTIITQRLFGLILSVAVLLLVIVCSRNIYRRTSVTLVAFLLTFGSFTYLYLSNLPYSSQTMSASLMIAITILSTTIKKASLRRSVAALFFAVLAFTIRSQAIPAAFVFWLCTVFPYRKKFINVFLLTSITIFFTLTIYWPFMRASFGNFLYYFWWPLQADKILVYQYYNSALKYTDIIRYTLDVFRDYGVVFALLIGIIFSNFHLLKKHSLTRPQNFRNLLLLCILLVALTLTATSFLHKPPYASYIYPAFPMYVVFIAILISRMFALLKQKGLHQINNFIWGILLFLFLSNIVLYPHVDHIKTSLASASTTPYSELMKISNYIESKTSAGSEILAFYLPAVTELNREVPMNLNQGEVSISLLSDEESNRYHLANTSMLRAYIRSKKAEAIVFNNRTPNSFAITTSDRELVLKDLQENYFLDKEFNNFHMIGNPKVTTLYIYLRK